MDTVLMFVGGALVLGLVAWPFFRQSEVVVEETVDEE